MIGIQRPLYRFSTATFCALSTISPGAYGQSSASERIPHAAIRSAAPTMEFGPAMIQSMARMDKDMRAAPMTGDPDHDFSAMMIPHHQGAVDMAKTVLLYGKDPVLKRLAQEIIVTQQQEIEVMRLRLAAVQANEPVVPQNPKTESTDSAKVSSHDRVYTADQTSGTISVIDPASNKLLGVIRLGDPVPGALSPLYRGQLLVHGLGFSPDHRTLAVVAIGSNAITLIDTAN